MRPLRCTVLALLALAGVAGVGGCAALPPKPKPVKLPTDAPLTLSGLTGDQGDWPAEKWWKHYGDPVLDQLIDMALASSPTLATAHARFDSAEQSVRIGGAAAGARV